MTDVASLELCKELYELSGWKETKYYWHSLISHDMKRWSDFKLQDYKPDDDFGMKVIPAYDLSYLLRKLPVKVYSEFKEQYCYLYVGPDEQGWQAGYQDVNGFTPTGHCEFAHTPEDAACKLLIELIKQGLLK